jgi:diguanylate cyclase (GGDEF)-like protein/PAS domain S-box-containing protein
MDYHSIQTEMKIVEELLNCGSYVWVKEQPNKLYLSEHMCQLIEIDTVESMELEQLVNYIHPEEYDDALTRLTMFFESEAESIDILLHVLSKTGKILRVTCRLKCTYNSENELSKLVGVCININTNHPRDYSTRLNDEKFYRLFGDAPIGISLLRTDGMCFLCNESFVENVSYKEFELKELPFYTLIDDEDQHAFMSLYQSVIDNKLPSFRNEFRIVNKNGEKVWNDVTISTVKDMYGTIKYFIVMIQPSQRNKKAGPRKGLINSIREELNDLSLRDSMSGLYNRQYLLRRLRELILVFYEKHLSFSALLIDVDRIGEVNDTFGHGCGDKIIHDLSDIFKSLTRDTDICARWGGEEFVILFPEMDLNTAKNLGERLRNEVKNTIMVWEGKEIQMTVSVSVTAYDSDDTLKSFINKLDHALYDNKNRDRDSVRII